MNAMQRRGLAAASPAGASTSGRTVVAAPVQLPCQPAGTRRATAAWADNAAAAIRVNSACVRRLLHLRPAAVAAKDDAATEEAADGVVGAEYDLSPDVFEEGAPPLPKPGSYQQTLVTSFTVGGVGLHTAEYAYVRVRPAFAGEGRYFVRVPKGTNSGRYNSEDPPPQSPEDLAATPPSDPEIEGLKLQIFKAYVKAREEQGFEGSLMQYLQHVDVQNKIKLMEEEGEQALRGDWDFGEPEEVQARGVDEKVWNADVYSVQEGDGMGQRLVDSEGEVLQGVEMLLSALEACGVDNARIEIEGGSEVPIVDGSALGWALNIQFSGLRHAPTPAGYFAEGESQDKDAPALRMALRPQTPFVVRDRDAFIQFIPENTIRLTVGIDHSASAEVIGKQWKSWSPYEDMHYRFELAGARQYAESPESVVTLGALDYYKAGTDGVVMVAHLDNWWEAHLLRFPRDESVRHAMLDLIGDLSLNATSGHAGLPIGHVVAYKPDHELATAFVRALHTNTSEDDWVPMMHYEDDDVEEQEAEAEKGQGQEAGQESS